MKEDLSPGIMNSDTHSYLVKCTFLKIKFIRCLLVLISLLSATIIWDVHRFNLKSEK